MTLEIARPGFALRGVAGDGERTYAALAGGGHGTVEARRGETVAWSAAIDGTAGVMARTGDLVIATAAAEGGAFRGKPGALAVGLDAATGAVRWTVAADATGWSVIAAIAPFPDGGAIVGGSFAGTLRMAAHVVSSAGSSDGFVARLSPKGEVVWLARLGGSYADGVQGVAATPGRDPHVVIAGTFTSLADVRGLPLEPIDEQLATADGFVAELDAAGSAVWAHAFGSKADDAVAGVAVDARGRIAVAATARRSVQVGNAELPSHGAADGLVVWYSASGAVGNAIVLGGDDFDGLRAIAAVGDGVVVGGFFSGAIKLGERALTAGGGDDAFLAAVDADGNISASWQVGGEGREEIVALSPVPGGFVAAVAHTATASVDGVRLPSPSDPMTGAAIVVR